jgi:hypothetical protein
MFSKTNKKLFSVSIVCVYCIFRISGVLPIAYNFKTDQFESSFFAFFYTLIIMGFIQFFLPISTAIISSNFHKSFDSSAITIYNILAECIRFVILSFYAAQIYQSHRLKRQLNCIVKLYLDIASKLPNCEIDHNHWIIFNIFQLVITHIYFAIVFQSFKVVLVDTTAYYLFHASVTIIPLFFFIIFTNVFTNLLIVILVFYRIINSNVQEAVQTLNNIVCVKTNAGNYGRLKLKFAATEQLEKSLVLHRKISETLASTNWCFSHLLFTIFVIWFGLSISEVAKDYNTDTDTMQSTDIFVFRHTTCIYTPLTFSF